MEKGVERLRWFFESEDGLLPFAGSGGGTIAKVELVKRPEYELSRGPFFYLGDFEAKIIGPSSLITPFIGHGFPTDKIIKITFALPLDYNFPFDHQNGWYDVS